MTSVSRRAFLAAAGRHAVLGLGAVSLVSTVLTGCSTTGAINDLGKRISETAEAIKTSKLASINKSTQAIAKTFEDFTPEQEYYIGRTVGAVILDKYPPWNNPAANTYVNVLGQTLAQASDRPETYGGYHFLIQNSDEINALAAPGGLIFVTRGMLRCCRTEDAVAAVLAHEIGHVQHRHGLKAIKSARVTQALVTLGTEGAKLFMGEQLAELTQTFQDSIMDITATMINSGYSRELERQADAAAVTILDRVGYNPYGLVEMLQTMQERLKPGALDFAATHPLPVSRVSDLSRILGPETVVKEPRPRQDRFRKALGKV